MDDRRAVLRDAAARRYDVIVIGGGINGAGIARDAAARGLAVLLLEKQDWGFGTTWRSTKLIHGGLRYLEHGEVPLVFESLRERAVLLRTAAHLVRPIPFLLPVYAGGRHGLPVLRAGLTLYDLLALGGGLPRHKALTAAATRAAEPRLATAGLRGGLAYWDCQVELPERLCLENVLRARDAGAVTLTYTQVEGILAAGGRVAGVRATDVRCGGSYEFRAPAVVNAAGPSVDQVLRGTAAAKTRLGGTRGAHIVVRFADGGPRRPIYAEAAADRRPFFIIPWRGAHLIGTTDVRVREPEDVLPSDAEIEYLTEATSDLLPSSSLRYDDIWYAYGGIRPLPLTGDTPAGAITRRHHIVDHASEGYAGLVSAIGGKLSTYRSLAEQVANDVCRARGISRRSTTAREALVPGGWRPAAEDLEAARLWRIYGPRGEVVLSLQRARPELGAPLCEHTLDTVAQALHAITHESALTIGDVLLRRTPAGWSRCRGLDAAPRVADLLTLHFCWDAATREGAIQAYAAEIGATFREVPGGRRGFE